jgi:hypothetical protein
VNLVKVTDAVSLYSVWEGEAPAEPGFVISENNVSLSLVTDYVLCLSRSFALPYPI